MKKPSDFALNVLKKLDEENKENERDFKKICEHIVKSLDIPLTTIYIGDNNTISIRIDCDEQWFMPIKRNEIKITEFVSQYGWERIDISVGGILLHGKYK